MNKILIYKDKCNIQYYLELNPTPQILDKSMLGNIPEPWSVVCSKNDPIPNPLEASKYMIIKKKDLCQCSLSAGTWFIQKILFIVMKLVVIYSSTTQ